MLVYTTRTCSNDVRAARAARRRRSSPGRCLPGGAAILPPKSSPPGESVVIASYSGRASKNKNKNETNVCLANAGDNGYQSHNAPSDDDVAVQRPRSSAANVTVQQLDRAVNSVELLKHRPSAASPFSNSVVPSAPTHDGHDVETKLWQYQINARIFSTNSTNLVSTNDVPHHSLPTTPAMPPRLK